MPDRIEVRGAAKRGVDYIEVPTAQEAYIAALLEERRGYADDFAAGREMRHEMPVAATLESIDAQIRAAGGTVPTPAPAKLPEAPVATEPGCEHPDCVLVHPHAGPAILDANAASRAGLIFDKVQGGYRRRPGPSERKQAAQRA